MEGRLVVSLVLASAPFYGDRTWMQFKKRPMSSAVLPTIIDDMQAAALDFYRMCLDRELLLAVVMPRRARPPNSRTARCFR